VVNSFASSVTARNTVVVHQELSRHHTVEVVETHRRGHATRIAQDAARRTADVVVAYGGDGTLNEVATGIAGTETALAVLPGGSTNVFARTLGMPNDPVKAVRCLVAGLDAADIRPIGLGMVNGRYFCFHTGIGFDAAVVDKVEKYASLKRWAGHPLFIWASLSTWLHGYDRRRPHFSLCFPDGSVVDDGYFTVVLNTNPYTFLGNRPIDLSPAATLERGLVAVTFRTLKARSILTSLASALKGGGMKPAPYLHEMTDLSALVVESAGGVPYQLDGDFLGAVHELRFEHRPDAVQLAFPKTN